MNISTHQQYSANKNNIDIKSQRYDIHSLFSKYIGKGKSKQEVIDYLYTLNISSRLSHVVSLIDAYERAQGIHAREFDKTIRKLSVYTDNLKHITATLYEKILPVLNNDLAVYTFKKFKKQYTEYMHIHCILGELEDTMMKYYAKKDADKNKFKKQLLLYYRSIYSLKEMTESMATFFLKFKLPKCETKHKNISLTMIDDYPLYGENLLFGRYATNIRSRHFHEEFETAIKNYKTAIAGVIPRMNHNSKLLNASAEKIFKKNFKTPISDIFLTITLWCIEAVHVSESMAVVLKSLGDPNAPQEMPDEKQKERGYAAVEAFDGTLICEVTQKENKIAGLRYYDAKEQNAKSIQRTIKHFIDENKTSTELEKNLKLLYLCVMPRNHVQILITPIPEKKPEKQELKPKESIIASKAPKDSKDTKS